MSALATSELSKEITDKSLADAARRKLSYKEIGMILSKSGRVFGLTKAEENVVMAEASVNLLTDQEQKRALASAAEKSLANEKIKNALGQHTLIKAAVDKTLTAAANEALKGIKSRDCRSLSKPFADEIIDLGLALYEDWA